MKKFEHWGIKIRKDLDRNYYSIWSGNDLKTTRLDLGEDIQLDPHYPEFIDLGITERCNVGCPFCYVNANPNNKDYEDICGVWERWMKMFPEDVLIDPLGEGDDFLREVLNSPIPQDDYHLRKLSLTLKAHIAKGNPFRYTHKMFQVAIGSVGEPTLHPDFTKLLKVIYDSGVVPNYTTAGLILSYGSSGLAQEILQATKDYCGGVAVSYGNKHIRDKAKMAIENLVSFDDSYKIMIHHLISDKNSVDEMIEADKEWGSRIHYHVALPLMKSGRSTKGMEPDTFVYFCERIKEEGMTNVALGANFTQSLKDNPGLLNVWSYPTEHFSHNVLLKEGKVIITPSSYNLEPIVCL